MKKVGIKIYGLVQGVGFRFLAGKKSEELGVSIRAINKPDKSVYIEAEGDEKNLQKFIEWCHVGPEGSMVERVEIEPVY
jgi:acylphosphatase